MLRDGVIEVRASYSLAGEGQGGRDTQDPSVCVWERERISARQMYLKNLQDMCKTKKGGGKEGTCTYPWNTNKHCMNFYTIFMKQLTLNKWFTRTDLHVKLQEEAELRVNLTSLPQKIIACSKMPLLCASAFVAGSLEICRFAQCLYCLHSSNGFKAKSIGLRQLEDISWPKKKNYWGWVRVWRDSEEWSFYFKTWQNIYNRKYTQS